MSSLKYSSYEGGWAKRAVEEFGMSQAVRVPPGGTRIEISGQGGWDRETLKIPEEEEAQIAQAFENVQAALLAAGVKDGWGSVYSVRSYHTGDSKNVMGLMIPSFKKWMPNHKPIWTELGVAKLGAPAMKVEIDVVAYEK